MPDTVRVIATPQVFVRVIRNETVTRVIGEPATRVVRVITEGPQGPQGPAGGDTDPGDLTLIFDNQLI